MRRASRFDEGVIVRARFFYDIVCPYAYLASTQIERLIAETGAEIEWVPMLLGGVFRAHRAPQVPAQHMTPAKARMNTLDLARWAKRWEVPFQFSAHHPQRTVEAMRLLCITPSAQRPQVSDRLFRAYWSEGARLDEALVERVAAEFDLLERWHSAHDEAKTQLFINTELAVSFGIFGAPSFEIDGEIFWGQDRLELVKGALGGTPKTIMSGQAPRGTSVEIFHDFSSPFSYLGCQHAERLITDRGAEVRWRPMLLGALFKSIGAPIVPLFEMNEAKRTYMGKDLNDWAHYWEVPFVFPMDFPLNTVTALRLAIIDPSLTPTLYRAAWGEGLNLGDREVLSQLLQSRDLDVQSLFARAQDQTIKDTLRENTAAAEAQGAFGAPSFVLHRPDKPAQLFWGQDRLELLCEAICASPE